MQNSLGKKVFRGTVVIVLVGILAKLSSFVSEAVLAAYLGTTAQSDAYYMVSSIQLVFYPMLSVGIWKVFLPIYKEKTTKGDLDGADRLANQSITFFTVISLVVVALLILLAGPVVSLVAPGFTGETRETCIRLVRISAPMYMLIIAAAVYASMLQSHNKFLGSQIREVASHIPTILAAIFFYRRFGINAMAIALVAGGLVRLLVELPFVDWGYRFRPDFRLKDPEFELMLKRLPSALVSEGVTQLNTLIDKAMASTLPVGTVSSLNYGHKLMNVFSGLLSTAIATALYPQMIELIALQEKEKLSNLVVKIINIFSVLMLPVTLACVMFRTEMVSVVYGRGSFGPESVILTAGVFAFYCLGLFFIASNTVINNLFYGFGDTKTPMVISLANLVINVLLNLLFIHFWGVNGLALATSASAFITFFIRMYFAEKRITMNLKSLLWTAARVLLASAVAFGLPWLGLRALHLGRLLTLILGLAAGVLLYLGMLRLLKVRELTDVVALAKRKLRGRKGNKK